MTTRQMRNEQKNKYTPTTQLTCAQTCALYPTDSTPDVGTDVSLWTPLNDPNDRTNVGTEVSLCTLLTCRTRHFSEEFTRRYIHMKGNTHRTNMQTELHTHGGKYSWRQHTHEGTTKQRNIRTEGAPHGGNMKSEGTYTGRGNTHCHIPEARGMPPSSLDIATTLLIILGG